MKSLPAILGVLLIAGFLVAIFNLTGRQQGRPQKWVYSDIVTRAPEIKSVDIDQQSQIIDGVLKNGNTFVADGPSADSPAWNDLVQKLGSAGAPVKFVKPPDHVVSSLIGLLSMIALPLLLIAVIYFLLIRPAQLGIASNRYLTRPILNPMSEILLPQGWVRPTGYSNGIAAQGRTIFVAGQIGWDAQQTLVSDDLTAQVRQALLNITAVLAEGGAKPENVVRMTWFIVDKEDYLAKREQIGAAYREVMGKTFPAMSLLIVKDLLEPGAKVEIEATAVVS